MPTLLYAEDFIDLINGCICYVLFVVSDFRIHIALILKRPSLSRVSKVIC